MYLSVSHEAPPRPEAPGQSHLRPWKVLAYFWFLPSQVTKTKGRRGEQEENISKGGGSDEEITRDQLRDTERARSVCGEGELVIRSPDGVSLLGHEWSTWNWRSGTPVHRCYQTISHSVVRLYRLQYDVLLEMHVASLDIQICFT